MSTDNSPLQVGVTVRERPIPFMGEMVRAILDGRKTQTRRVVQPPRSVVWSHSDPPPPVDVCPFGVPGDRLWVRETWQYADWTEDGMPWVRYKADGATRFHDSGSVPEAWAERLTDIWADLSEPANYAIDNRAADRRWRSPRFMPRWASRIKLEITAVHVERVRSITGEGARAEGVADPVNPFNFPAHHKAFATLWDSLNGPRGYGWDANPWVWVLGFNPAPAAERVSP